MDLFTQNQYLEGQNICQVFHTGRAALMVCISAVSSLSTNSHLTAKLLRTRERKIIIP